jgi:hypothetical protein
MAGVLFTHHITPQRAYDACFYFGQCTTDPIALVYLGMLAGDPGYLLKAATILGVKVESGAMYEMIGDLFAHGVKFHTDDEVASLFYGLALERGESAGEDLATIICKLSAIHITRM